MTFTTALLTTAVTAVLPFSCTYAPGNGPGPSDPGAPLCATNVWTFTGDVPDCDLNGSQTWSIVGPMLPGECDEYGGKQVGTHLCFNVDY